MADPDNLSVKRLELSVERSGEAGTRSAAAAAVDRDNPWPGLASFTEELRGFFYGREKETEELVRLIRRNTLTVLFGQSGLGKSSLLQAGAFPQLREADFLPLYLRLDHAPESPPLAEQVKSALAAAFASAGADAPAFRADETLWEYFHRKDNDIWSAKNRLLTPVLAFDQFEEIFTLGRADELRRERGRAFLAELADLVENRPPVAVRAKFESGDLDPVRYAFDKPSCQVILSLREDFLPDLEGLKHEMRSILHNRMRVKRLNGAQALEIVAKPAPHLLADGVAERIVEFVAGARGGSTERLLELEVEPALLSVICRELNERRRSLGQEKITPDLVAGNRREILTDFYERSVADLPAEVRAFVEDHLLTKSGFRDNLALETALEFPGVTRPLLDTLVARRLLRIEERVGVHRVELTHDVLAEVIRAARDSRQQRLALEQARERERLALAAAARHTKRQRWVIAGLVAAVVALSIGAVFGIRAQRQGAKQAGLSDFLLGSGLLDEGKLADGLAYLVRAGRKDPTNGLVAPRILTSLTAHNFCLPVGSPLALPSPARYAAYSADGQRLFVSGEDRILRIIDVAAWKIERELTFTEKIVDWSLPGKSSAVFAVGLANSTILVCEMAGGRPLLAPISPPGRFMQMTLSPDGRWLAARSKTTLWLWDATSGELKMTRPNARQNLRWSTFSPDSLRIATTTEDSVSQLWSVPDGAPIGKPIEDASYGAFCADGQRLQFWAQGGIKVYDLPTNAWVGPTPQPGSANSTGWLTPDGRSLVLYRANNRSFTVQDVATGKPVFPPFIHGGRVIEWGFSQDRSTMFTNCVDGSLRLWDMRNGVPLAEPIMKQEQNAQATLSPDGKTVVVFSTRGMAYRLQPGRGRAEPLALPRSSETVAVVNFLPTAPVRPIWLTRDRAKAIDVASGREVEGGFMFPAPIWSNPFRAIRSTYGSTLGPGQTLVPETQKNVWHAWTMGERGVVRDVPLEGVPAGAISLAMNPTGNLGATTDGQKTIGVWNLRSGRRVATFATDVPVVAYNQIMLSPDETRVAFRTNNGVVHLGEIASGKELFSLTASERNSFRTIGFSPDGTRLFTGDLWGGVQVWDATTGRVLRSSQPHRDSVERFDYSANGRFYASLSNDGTVQVWDAATDAAVGTPLRLSVGSVTRANFTPDNTRMATGSSDGIMRIWDIASGQPLTERIGLAGEAIGVVHFSPDGRFVATRVGLSGDEEQFHLLRPAPPDGRGARTPKWLLELATICAGERLNDEGKLVGATEEFANMEAVRRELTALPDDAPYVEWGRWFLSDSPTRSIAPGFTITPADAKKLREEMAAALPARRPAAVPAGTPTRKGKKKQ